MEQIQLVDIQAELHALWQREKGEKTHASLFNLIIYVQKTWRAEYFQDLTRAVVSKFPCRIILITVDPSPKEKYLRTEVRSETVSEGEQQLFCEVILIDVAGELVQRVPSIILPNLIPDLPIYLLWTQDPSLENEILPYFEPIAQRIIFDSESARNLQTYSQTLLVLSKKFHCEIGDLNWSAIKGWRALFNQIFGSLGTFSILADAKTLKINYNKTPSPFFRHPEIEAAYFQAWIASRMKWKFESAEKTDGTFRLRYTQPSGSVLISLVPEDDPSLPPGTLLSIELESRKKNAHFSFKRVLKSRQVLIHYSDNERCDIPFCVMLRGTQEGQEIVEEIFYPSAREHHRSMLEVLVQIPWATN